MLDLLLDFPLQCKAASKIAQDCRVLFEKKDFGKIVFCGMGGSAIGADLVRSYLYSRSRIPIVVCREYKLPAFIDELTLVFILSYSGNTKETISAYKEARERKASIIVMSSGGFLKEQALKDGVSFVDIPGSLPPRYAIGYMSIIPLGILAKLGLAEDIGPEVNQMARVLEELRDNNLNPRIAEEENIAKHIAAKLKNKFAAIYTPSIHFEACATRFRNQLNENSKALALSHVFPEMSHNEISGWENPKKLFRDFVAVMLRDKDTHPSTAKMMDVTCEILKKEDVKLLEVWSRGEGLLSRIFSLIYICDFASYYLAISYGIDPMPVERVDYLKKRLSEK